MGQLGGLHTLATATGTQQHHSGSVWRQTSFASTQEMVHCVGGRRGEVGRSKMMYCIPLEGSSFFLRFAGDTCMH